MKPVLPLSLAVLLSACAIETDLRGSSGIPFDPAADAAAPAANTPATVVTDQPSNEPTDAPPTDDLPTDDPPADDPPADVIVPIPPDSPTVPPACTQPASAQLADCTAGVAAVSNGQTFATVQGALTGGGARVEVCPGQWDGPFEVDRALVLASASGDPGDTVLVGNGGAGVRSTLIATRPLAVEALSFVDGWSAYAGGAIEANDGLALRCSVFVGNYADYEGGAVQIRGDAEIVDTLFQDNVADYEGGAVSWGDWDAYSLSIAGSTFTANSAGYSGGAVEIGTWAHPDAVEIVSSAFLENHDGYSDGVVNFDSWGGFVGVIDSCIFEDNDTAIGTNGWLEDGYTLDVTNTSFVGPQGSW